MRVELVVADARRPQRPAEVARARDDVAPGQLGRDADPDARRRHDRPRLRRASSSNGGSSSGSPSCSRVTAERLAEPARPGAEQPRVVEAATLAHHRRARGRLERPDQHGGGAPLLLADEVQAPVDPVRAVDVRLPAGPNIDALRGVRPRKPCAAGSSAVVRLDLDDRPPTPSTSSVEPISSGATSCTLRAKNSLRTSFLEQL